MSRHIGFGDAQAFRNYLQSNTPSDAYYSCAYYENPDEEMTAKGWLGADLIFDIDADHIPTPCDRKHDTWQCKDCGEAGRGARPKKCPKCSGLKFNSIGWPCDICLEAAKRETMKLTEILEGDFGFSSHEIAVAFSGHRGYHVQIENESIKTLDSMARKEIIDYLMGTGFEPTLHHIDPGRAWGTNLDDAGWPGRIAKGTYEFLTLPKEQLEKHGLGQISENLLSQRQQILERWKQKGPWGLVTGVGEDDWRRIIQLAIESKSVKVDSVVTTDIHRLIRLGNTLHGETGLLKIDVPISKIEEFDPFNAGIAFKQGETTVDVSEAPSFRLGDTIYGSYSKQKAELPTAAAMLLLCKGVAEITEEENHVQ